MVLCFLVYANAKQIINAALVINKRVCNDLPPKLCKMLHVMRKTKQPVFANVAHAIQTDTDDICTAHFAVTVWIAFTDGLCSCRCFPSLQDWQDTLHS